MRRSWATGRPYKASTSALVRLGESCHDAPATDNPLTHHRFSPDNQAGFCNTRILHVGAVTLPFNSIVLVKQVPDTANVTAEAMKEDGTVNRAALPTIFNPEDLNALETALEVRDRFGGTVTALTMGPPKAADVLRDCLFRGADRAILLTDRRAAASDTLATSYILSQAIKTIGRYDLVLAGRQAIDGDTAQVGPQCAEKLGIPQITYLEELVDLREGRRCGFAATSATAGRSSRHSCRC